MLDKFLEDLKVVVKFETYLEIDLFFFEKNPLKFKFFKDEQTPFVNPNVDGQPAEKDTCLSAKAGFERVVV